MKKYLMSLLGLIALASTACAQTPGDIDTRFSVKFSRTTEPLGIIAKITTFDTYPCEGYQIQTRVTQQRDTLTVHIGGIIEPIPCFTTFDVATGTAYLGRSLDGIHFLRFNYRTENDLYKLVVKGNNRIISAVHSDFTDLTN